MMNSKECVLLGYSGHGFVAAEIARLSGINLIGYVDNIEKSNNPFQLIYLGSDDYLENNNDEKKSLFIAIGNNATREKLYNKYSLYYSFETLIHSSAVISNMAQIGEASMIGANAIVNTLARIGQSVIINTSAIVEHECIIGDFVHVAPGAVLAGNVSVGNGTFIGANAVIKQGVSIGQHVTIGAGSVVINDIANHATVVGNPAKKILIK